MLDGSRNQCAALLGCHRHLRKPVKISQMLDLCENEFILDPELKNPDLKSLGGVFGRVSKLSPPSILFPTFFFPTASESLRFLSQPVFGCCQSFPVLLQRVTIFTSPETAKLPSTSAILGQDRCLDPRWSFSKCMAQVRPPVWSALIVCNWDIRAKDIPAKLKQVTELLDSLKKDLQEKHLTTTGQSPQPLLRVLPSLNICVHRTSPDPLAATSTRYKPHGCRSDILR